MTRKCRGCGTQLERFESADDQHEANCLAGRLDSTQAIAETNGRNYQVMLGRALAAESRLDGLIKALEQDSMCQFSKAPHNCLGWWNFRKHDDNCPIAIAKGVVVERHKHE